jgi:hypothetical protein
VLRQIIIEEPEVEDEGKNVICPTFSLREYEKWIK